MNRKRVSLVTLAAICIFIGGMANCVQAKTVWLSDLDLSKMTVGWGLSHQPDRNIKHGPLSIAGRSFEKGVGSRANSLLYVALNGGTSRFSAFVGVDDGAHSKDSVCFKIYGDEKILFDSDVMKEGQKAKAVEIKTEGVNILLFTVKNMSGGTEVNQVDWADARFEVTGDQPKAIDPPAEKKEILTPASGPAPRINGPAVFGTRPGNPFIYRIPTTGKRPMSFSVEALPESLKLDPNTGIITGNSPKKRGEYPILLKAKNSDGQDQRQFKLVVGDKLALTPPMGWNSWYIYYVTVTDADMRNAADAMVASGMADFGYMYVNIDESWSKIKGDEPYRDSCGAILPNEKFPDMAAMTAYIHSKGLRAGLYSSPGPWGCGIYTGSYQHEQIDAQQFAKWGFDFYKHDSCSYPYVDQTRYEWMRPYALMGEILKNVDRDIIYNVCQYGFDNVWEWGAKVEAQSWRTMGDLGWMSSFIEAGFGNSKFADYAGPGHWNDPDYILIGWIGDVTKWNDPNNEGIPVKLSPNQQYQYMSMWSLMASPLFFAGDMTKLDEFTLNVLCNAEVIAVNLDELGRQGIIVTQTDDYFVMVKPLVDGSKAVGIFNTSYGQETIKVSWKELGVSGRQSVRDLWRQRDLGKFKGSFETNISPHGVTMVRLTSD